MKLNKTLSSLALVLGLTAAAQAQNVYITGSTAFRAQIFNALGDLGLTVQQSGTSGNNSFTFTGTISDKSVGTVLDLSQFPGFVGSTVTVYANFSGSAEGVDDLITPKSHTYLSVGPSGSGTFNSSQIDIAMSDVSQASTPEANSADQLMEIQNATDGSKKPFTGVAVQPFAFVVDGNASAIQNITQENFKDLFLGTSDGQLPMSFFTGTNTNAVYAIGRYPLSGTRITAILDDQYGLPASKLTQWALSADGSTTPGLASTDTASPPTAGDQWLDVTTNGYFSGGNLGSALEDASVNSAPAALGYVSWSDASKLKGTAGDGPINWNGQKTWIGGVFPAASSGNTWNVGGVQNGSYTFWTYERMYISDSDQPPAFVGQTFAPGLIDALQYEITHPGLASQTAVLESQMSVYRSNDGSDVVHY
jgi:hypothetical protein